MAKPLVSVIIPNYNYAQYLPQALDSVLAQTYPHVEIIVVDDGSRDDSQPVVRKYGERVRLIQQTNQGVSIARNRGVADSAGELIAFLDADDAWLPMKLEKQVRRLIAEPGVGLVHCGAELVEPDGTSIGLLLEGQEGSVAAELLLFERPVIIAAGSTALIPRDIFTGLGGFDTSLSTSADWDLCYRIAVRWKVGFIKEMLVKYRIHTSNMHTNIKAMEHDMLVGYEKAFSSDTSKLPELRRRSYGNLHMVLAGSYFRAGQKTDFVRHALKSLWLRPGNIKSLLGYPLRRFRRTSHKVKG